MGIQIIRKPIYAVAGLLVFLSILVLNPFAPSAHAELNTDINLVPLKNIHIVSMNDWTWNQTPIDPSQPGKNPISNCGCWLAANATMLANFENGFRPNAGSPAWPWYPTLYKYSNPKYNFQELSWNPVYVLNYLRIGPNPDDPRQLNWGLKTFGGCGVLSKPSVGFFQPFGTRRFLRAGLQRLQATYVLVR